MRQKLVRIFIFFIILIAAATILCIKGCNSKAYPKQYPLPESEKKKINSTNFSIKKDSSISISAGPHYEIGGFHEMIFGTLYRDIWRIPVQLPVFDIRHEKGGMKVLKRGGNMQTMGLRLEAADGKKYVLRTVDKDQSNAIGKMWRNKVFNYIMRDETASLHPYGALIVPTLAEAAGIMHTNPKLYFIPYDPGFGKFANEYEGRVMLFEEFLDEGFAHTPQFNFADSIVSSPKMLEKRYSFQNVTIDQHEYIRARLFDLWINDWDRHTDQWRWAEYDKNGKVVYKPIPRDRDMVFFRFDEGLIPHLVIVFNPKFQSFNYDYDVPNMNRNTKYIDHTIFNTLTENDFVETATYLQSVMSDSLIEAAIKKWPPEVFAIEGRETISKLKVRRNKLVDVAKQYYHLVFEEMKIIGTDQKEKFIIERKDDNHTSVRVLNEEGEPMLDHIYDHSITKKINLFGLNNDDEFLIKGKVNKGIEINIYGGKGRDKVVDESYVKGWSKETRVYDTKQDTEIIASDETKNETSDDPKILYFDRVGIRKKE